MKEIIEDKYITNRVRDIIYNEITDDIVDLLDIECRELLIEFNICNELIDD